MSFNVYGNVYGVCEATSTPGTGETSPVNPCGGLRTLVIGDDYSGDRAFVWDTPATSRIDPLTAVAKFRGWKREYEWESTGTITPSEDGETWTLTFELTSMQTSMLEQGNYSWSVSLNDDGVVHTVVHWKQHQLATWILNEASEWR